MHVLPVAQFNISVPIKAFLQVFLLKKKIVDTVSSIYTRSYIKSRSIQIYDDKNKQNSGGVVWSRYVMSRQGRSLDVSLVINLQGQNKKARVLSASYEE